MRPQAAFHFRDATALAAAIRSKEVSAVELMQVYFDRVDNLNGKINAVVVQDRSRAMARAREADSALANGQVWGPLHGVPITIKESYNWQGHPTTWGVPEMRDNIAAQDALAVQRLERGGAIVFGKTNVPIRLADFQSYNEIYGVTKNPWNIDRTPGGSSGGSAAALAAGLSALEIGSDIGGSIRNPAHYCGVFGLKPTWNLIPMRGHALAGSLTPTDISVLGPLARSARDLETALRLLAGPDELDASGYQLQLPPLDRSLAELRVAAWPSEPQFPASVEVQDRVMRVARVLGNLGAKVSDSARPNFAAEHSHSVFQQLLTAAMSARTPDAEYQSLLQRANGLAEHDHSEAARVLRSQTIRYRDWSTFNEARTALRWQWHEFFRSYDVLICPIMPTAAFPHDHRNFGARVIRVDGRELPYFYQTFWAGLSGVAYLPSVIIPTGPNAEGLPIGVQLIGPALSDLRLVHLAQRIEALGFNFAAPPGF